MATPYWCTALVVTRMDTPKPGWTPYVVYTTEILLFLHNRNIISNGKRSFKNQISVRITDHLLHSSYPYPLDQGELADKNDNF